MFGFFGGSIVNKLGPRLTLSLGSLGYSLYIAALYSTVVSQTAARENFVIVLKYPICDLPCASRGLVPELIFLLLSPHLHLNHPGRWGYPRMLCGHALDGSGFVYLLRYPESMNDMLKRSNTDHRVVVRLGRTGALMMAYSTEDTKGRYIAIFWAIFNLGAVIGSSIPLGQNWNSGEASAVGGSTYIVSSPSIHTYNPPPRSPFWVANLFINICLLCSFTSDSVSGVPHHHLTWCGNPILHVASELRRSKRWNIACCTRTYAAWSYSSDVLISLEQPCSVEIYLVCIVCSMISRNPRGRAKSRGFCLL